MKKHGLLLALCLLLFVQGCDGVGGVANLNLNKKAPEFTLDTTLQEEMKLTVFRGNHAAIIFFWATWCPHCQKVLLKLNEDADYYEEKGIKIIPVNIGESFNVVEDYLVDRDIVLEVFLDVDSSVAQDYALRGVPIFFFVDRTGTIKKVAHHIPDGVESLML